MQIAYSGVPSSDCASATVPIRGYLGGSVCRGLGELCKPLQGANSGVPSPLAVSTVERRRVARADARQGSVVCELARAVLETRACCRGRQGYCCIRGSTQRGCCSSYSGYSPGWPRRRRRYTSHSDREGREIASHRQLVRSSSRVAGLIVGRRPGRPSGRSSE